MLVGGVLLWREAAVRALQATCAPSPCASKVIRKPKAFSSGAGPSQNGTCSECGIGRKIRAGSAVIFFGWVGSESITPVSLHRVEEWVLSGQNLSKQSYNGSFLLLARSCMHDICGFWR